MPTIALIYDEKIFVDSLVAKLAECGFAVTPLYSADSALQWLATGRPDAVILAHPLQNWSAIRLAEEIQRQYPNCGITILGNRTDPTWTVLPKTHRNWGMVPLPGIPEDIVYFLNRWGLQRSIGPVAVSSDRFPKGKALTEKWRAFSWHRFKTESPYAAGIVRLSLLVLFWSLVVLLLSAISADRDYSAAAWSVLVAILSSGFMAYGLRTSERSIVENLKSVREIGAAIGKLLIPVCALLAAVATYAWLDDSGWIPHSRETTITAKFDWLVGENKTCMSYPLDFEAAKLLKVTPYDVTHEVYCDGGEEHKIKVTFWGKTERPDKDARENGVHWKCVKNADSFTCSLLN